MFGSSRTAGCHGGGLCGISGSADGQGGHQLSHVRRRQTQVLQSSTRKETTGGVASPSRHAGGLRGSGGLGDLATIHLAGRRQAARDYGCRGLRVEHVVARSSPWASGQAVLRQGHGCAGRNPSGLQHPDAAGRVADDADNRPVRPFRVVHAADAHHSRSAVLRDVPGGETLAERARRYRRRRVLRPVFDGPLAGLVPPQHRDRIHLPAGHDRGRSPVPAQAAHPARRSARSDHRGIDPRQPGKCGSRRHLGVAAGWRKRSTWAFVALWLVGAALALGTSLTFGNCQGSSWRRPGTDWGRACHQYLPLMAHGYSTRVFAPAGPVNGVWKPVVVSNLMPYTWLVRIPGLAGMREADRFAIVGLIGTAMLAGLAVQLLSKRKITRPLIAVVLALGALEAGWSGAARTSPGYQGVMPTALPRLNHFLSSDHSGSIAVDFPYGLRGGVGATGSDIAPAAMLIATDDGHPRAISNTSWVSKVAIKGIARHAFFRYLYQAEDNVSLSAADVSRAKADLETMHIGWVLMLRNVWTRHKPRWRYGYIDRYLTAVAFRHVKSACVAAEPVSACHWNQRVWLYRYEPGARGKAWRPPRPTSAQHPRGLRD